SPRFRRRCRRRSRNCTSNAAVITTKIDNLQTPEILGIIAGNGVYPRILAGAARKAGVRKIVAAAFTNETDPSIDKHVDVVEWLRVGQLSRLLKFFREHEVHRAIMAGQIAPKNLFDLRPDVKALVVLAKLKQRNA